MVNISKVLSQQTSELTTQHALFIYQHAQRPGTAFFFEISLQKYWSMNSFPIFFRCSSIHGTIFVFYISDNKTIAMLLMEKMTTLMAF